MKRSHAKNLVLPVAMIGGAIFYPWMDYLTFLSPYLIFLMLCITYCRMTLHDLRLRRRDWLMLCAQWGLGFAVYFLLNLWDNLVASGVMVCVIIPTATAAPVITAMLGGNLAKVASYSLLSNLAMAIFGPFVLAFVSHSADIDFMQSTLLICSRVFPLLLLPLIVAWLLRRFSPKVHTFVSGHQGFSFYLWAISLFIIVGGCVSFAIKSYTPERTVPMVALALGALAVCLLQFYLGKKIGGTGADRISGGQSLGQKNTVLAVWIALVYLDPLASIAPAAYIAWQNALNSWQLMRHEERRQMDALVAEAKEEDLD